jgi:hypothetical protein
MVILLIAPAMAAAVAAPLQFNYRGAHLCYFSIISTAALFWLKTGK